MWVALDADVVTTHGYHYPLPEWPPKLVTDRWSISKHDTEWRESVFLGCLMLLANMPMPRMRDLRTSAENLKLQETLLI